MKRTVCWLNGLLCLITLSGMMGCGGSSDLPDDHPSSLILVELTATDCDGCQDVHGAVQDTRDRYENRVRFVTLDMSNSGGRQDAMEMAQQFGGEVYVDRFADSPGTVFIMDSNTGKLMTVLTYETDADHYAAALEEAMKESAGEAKE